MSTRLLLVRHGQTVHNAAQRIAGWTDSPLTPEGLRQAERVAAFLAETDAIHALYASPLQRAWRTAEAIGKPFGLAPQRHDDLRELHFGECENLTADELRARYPEIWERSRNQADAHFRWPNGESRIEFWGRVRRALEEIVTAHTGSTVAVVAHGGVVSSYVASIIEGEPARWWQYPINNCAVSEIQIANERVEVVRCNVDHFLL